MNRSLGSGRGFKRESWYIAEDLVVGDERHSEAQCGCCDPAVSLVRALGERMADLEASDPEACMDQHEFWAGVHNLDTGELRLHLQHA